MRLGPAGRTTTSSPRGGAGGEHKLGLRVFGRLDGARPRRCRPIWLEYRYDPVSGPPIPAPIAIANCVPACAVLQRRYPYLMLDWSQCSAVERIAGKVSGAWLFKGTRVPVKALFENLEGGATVDEFLEWFPGVTRSQVDAVLEHAQRSLVGA